MSRWFRYGSRIVTGALCLVVVVTPALVYSRMLLLIGVVVVLHMVYLMAGLAHAALRRMEGALIFLLVSVVALATVINDFLYYNEWSPHREQLAVRAAHLHGRPDAAALFQIHAGSNE
ncbi:hypothetical protein ACFSQ7_46490 [Paenibacillus rhizoplanae]